MIRAALVVCCLLATFAASVGFADEEDLLNARIDTVGALHTEPNIYLDFQIARAWTIGPGLRLRMQNFDSDSHEFTSSENYDRLTAQFRANYFPDGAYASGLYIGASLDYNRAKLRGNDTTATGANAGLSAFIGHAWFWSNFNMMLGGGGHLFLGGDSDVKITTPSGQNPKTGLPGSETEVEFTLGWTT